MKKARRIIALLCFAALLFGVVACAGTTDTPPSAPADPPADPPADTPADTPDEPSAAGPVEIVFCLWGDESELEGAIATADRWNAMQDRSIVSVMQIPNEEYVERLMTMAAAGNMPDCGMVNERAAIGMSRDGLLLQYDLYAGQPERPLESITFRDKGEYIAASIGAEVLALWFNRDMFDAAGVPYPPTKLEDAWSWDEFIAVAKQLTFDADGNTPNDAGFDKNNIVQYGAYVNQWAWQLEVWAYSNGGRWYSEDGTAAVFDDAAIEGMQKVFDLHLVHNVAPFNPAQSDDGFLDSLGAGNVAMCTEGQWATGFANFLDVEEINYGCGVLPYMLVPANITAGGPVGAYAGTQHPEEVAEFLRWYSDPENNFAPIYDGWVMPNVDSWYKDEALMKKWIDDVPHRARLGVDEYRTVFAEVIMNNDVTKPTGWNYTPNTDKIDVILIPALVEAINGTKTAKEVIESVRAELEAAVAG